MDAILFDFDGVIVDSEPIHLAAFQQVLGQQGLTLSREDYYSRYLGYDDRDCFGAVGRDKGKPFAAKQIAEMTAAKTQIVQDALAESIQAMPGAVELISAAAEASVPLAICSGALRGEIVQAARTVGVLGMFPTIIAAEDVQRGKPDPQGYRLAAEALSADLARPVRHERCVVVEDSPAGIEAGKALGMKVLAVTNSYEAQVLAAADRVVDSLAEVTLESLETL